MMYKSMLIIFHQNQTKLILILMISLKNIQYQMWIIKIWIIQSGKTSNLWLNLMIMWLEIMTNKIQIKAIMT